MTLLIGLGLLQVPADADVLPEEDLAVIPQPVQHLLHVLLEQPQSESLMQLDFLRVPLGLERPVMGEDVVDHGQHVTRAFRVIRRWIFRLLLLIIKTP